MKCETANVQTQLSPFFKMQTEVIKNGEINQKIQTEIAKPVLCQVDNPKDSVTIPLEHRIDADVAAPKKLVDRINDELKCLDKMLEDPNCDHSLLLQQAYRIIGLLHRISSQIEKSYVLDKEAEVWNTVQDLKGSHNSWKVLGIACLAGGLTSAGGFANIGSVFPGTEIGKAFATSGENPLFKFFAESDNAKVLVNLGDGMKGVGQGSSVFQDVFSNSDKAKQVVYQHLIDEGKRKQGDRQDAYRQSRDQTMGATNNCRQVADTIHRAIEYILKGSST